MTPSSLFVQPNVFRSGLPLPLGHLFSRRPRARTPSRLGPYQGCVSHLQHPPPPSSRCHSSVQPAPYLSVYSALSRIHAGGLVIRGRSRVWWELFPPAGSGVPSLGLCGSGVFSMSRECPRTKLPLFTSPCPTPLSFAVPMTAAALVLGPGRPYHSGLDSLVALPVFSSDINCCPGRSLLLTHDAPSLVHS